MPDAAPLVRVSVHTQRLGALKEIRKVKVVDVITCYNVGVRLQHQAGPALEQLGLVLKRHHLHDSATRSVQRVIRHSEQQRAGMRRTAQQ